MESAVCLSSINESVFLPAEDILLNWPVIAKMFRRSRFSIRPNVGTAGRTAATPQEAPSSNQESSETPRDISESSTPTAVTDTTSDVTPSEKATTPGDGNDQNAEGASSSAAVQRRKRFTVKPKVVPGRPSTLSRTSKSPAKAVAEAPIETPVSDLDKPSSSIQSGTTAAPQGLQSPRRRRGSEESRQPKVQPKPTPDSSEPSAVPPPEESLEQTDQPTDSGKQLESKSGSQVKEVPPRPPDKEPVSLPDREADEISERAKTLVSSKSGLSLSPSALSLSRLLNDPSDLQRLAKAQKLRELLRQERHKEKKLKKVKPYLKEYTLDPTKMTMRDLIHYLPLSNPMTSSSEDIAQENETVLPPSPQREQSPDTVQEPEAPPELPSTREDEEEMAEEEDDDAFMVPQVKVAEDGSLIIDEESLTVEVQRAKGPNPAQDRDPIFERGSTTTYSSFRKSSYTKPWSSEETDMFYLAVSMVGTDFSMICQLFPHRARSEIKNKFKKEERANSWRVDKAFRERRKLDIEYFSKLLEKILEVQENRKKLKSLAKKNSPKKSKRKAKGKKAARTLSDVEEENEEDANEVPSLEDEEEGEKENENLCNEGGTPVSKPKRPSKRKAKQAAVNEEPNDKKKKTGEKSSEQGEACIPEDPEAALPEVQTTSDMSEKTEDLNASKDTAIKPAKLSRGRAPKPLLPLGRKWSKKRPPDSKKAKDTASDKEDESLTDGASKEQVNQDSSPLREDNERMSDEAHVSSEEEDVTAQPPRPTRYGRVPKPTKPLNYPAKEDAHTSASDATPASPGRSAASAAKPKPKCTAKRGRPSKQQSAQQSKKPKLVTLRSSRSEFSDDEEEKQQDQEEVEEEEYPVCSPGEDSAAPVFVPASLRSPPPVISEVEETMEELDILANMPDVLGLSQLCPDSSFELVQNETGTAEPCEHQLDLLVDVIDFLSSEHTEVNEDESYNEAAQTLLTIGNLTQLSAQNQIVTQDNTGTTSVGAEQTEPYLGGADQEENYDIHIMFGHGDAETSEIIATVEPQQGTRDSGDAPVVESSDQPCGGQNTVSFTDCSPQFESSPEIAKKHSPQTRKGHWSKVKPNLGGGSRTEQPKSQPDTSTEQETEESNTEASNIQVTESPSAPEGTTPKILEYSSTSSIDDKSSTKVEHTEEPCVTQDSSGTAAFDQSASEHQSHCSSDAQFEPSGEATRDMTFESSDQSFSNNLAASETSDSVPVHKGSPHCAAFITPVDDVPVSQKEEAEVASTCQIRRGRSQKVKPKPVLAQTKRTARSKPHTTVEKDPSPAPVPQIHEKTIVEVEQEATCGMTPEKVIHSTSPTAAMIPLFDSGSPFTPTKELSTTEEKSTGAGLDQSVSQNQILTQPSDRDTGSTSGSTDEKMATCDQATESSDKLATSFIESQVGQDSAPVQESSDHTPPSVTLVDDVPVSQKEESEVASTCQIRRGRSQKAKPKPNLAQTRAVRSKPETTKATVEKDPSPAPVPQINEKTIVEVVPEATGSASPEKPNHSTGPAAALIPSFDSGSALTLTKELSTTEEKRTEGGLDQSVSQNQILTEPSIRDTGSTSGSTDEKMATCDETTESSDNLVTSDSAVTKLQVGQNSAPVQESSGHPAPSVTLVDDVPVSQKEESEVASSCQIRRGQSQKLKPKPNLAQTRTARSKPQTTKATVEKDPSPTPVPQTSPAAAMRPSFDSGSALAPTKELSTTEEKSTEGGLEQMATCDEATESGDKLATSVTESHVWQDSALVQESSGHHSPAVTLVDDVPVSQKEESEVASTCQIIRGRSQKAKPKPNLAQTRTARSKPQAAKATVETDPSPAPVPQIHEKTIKVEPKATRSTSPASVLIPLFDLGSTLTPTQELSTTEDKRTADALAGQVYAQNQNISETSNIDTGSTSGSTDEKMATGDAVSVQESCALPASCVKPEDLPVSQKEEREVASTCQIRRGRAPKVKPKPNLAQTTRTPRSKPQTTKEPVMHVQLVETPSSPTLKPQSTEKTTADTEAPPICSISLPIQSVDTSLVSVQSLELCSTHKPTEESSTPMEQKTEVGPNAISEISEPNVRQRRQQFPKVKPNLASSTTTARTKLQPKKISELSDMDTSSNVTSEPPPVDSSLTEVKLVEEDFKLLTSTQCPLNTEPSSTKSAPAESDKTEGTSSDSIVVATSSVAENQYLLTNTITESETSEMSTGDKMSNNDSVKTEPASQVSDSITASDPQSPEGGSTESKISSGLASNVYSITTIHPTESGPQSCPEGDSEVKSQEAVQQCSETRATHQTSSDKSQSASSTDRSQLELTDSSKSSKKGPQSRRGRLINPKPNLGRCSRPQQPQQVQNTAQAEAGVEASVSLNPVSELRPDIQDPVEGAVESNSNQESCPKQSDSHSLYAVSSLGCVTQTVDNSSQNTSTFGTEGTQSHPCLQLFPDLTSEQMPSDPDEPFFILSLSEIPVCSSGEVMDSAAEPLPYLPDGYAPMQPQSVPGESLAPQEDTSLSNVPVSMSVEESSEMGFLSGRDEGRDSAVHKDSVMENREDPQETVQPPTLPETVEKTAKTETNLTKKRISGTGRRAKVQVKPNTSKKTQASKTVAVNTNQDSGLPGPSTQAEASDAKTTAGKVEATEPQKRSGDHVDIGLETPSVGKSPEDRSPRAQTGTIKTSGTRKSGDFPSFLSDKNSSDLPCGEAASKDRKVKTAHTRKHSTSTSAASTSPAVTPTPAHTQQPEEPSHSASSSTSAALTQCAAKVSAPQQSVESSATEVEPTSVSQYFLSDIFTEVE
ncbi:transcription factor TFIIIB component B'' homolog isoform X2 [Paralichthys olivaceus]|uniref:transcription factor TFIIIB component B'' homolog isoform X2 n=1 Tax=Paralichthys olivaceus TaxID=8255 RepID=UPI0037527F23